MPTTRPRYHVTETPEIARALDLAAKRWPGESRARLLLRLVAAGREVLDERSNDDVEQRRRAVERTSGKYRTSFDDDYLAALRRDWPE
jgi:hypothetical protein